jgi:hypothetical protein
MLRRAISASLIRKGMYRTNPDLPGPPAPTADFCGFSGARTRTLPGPTQSKQRSHPASHAPEAVGAARVAEIALRKGSTSAIGRPTIWQPTCSLPSKVAAKIRAVMSAQLEAAKPTTAAA